MGRNPLKHYLLGSFLYLGASMLALFTIFSGSQSFGFVIASAEIYACSSILFWALTPFMYRAWFVKYKDLMILGYVAIFLLAVVLFLSTDR